MNKDKFEQFYAKDRQEWREWLAKNHATAPGIWLIYYKKGSGKPRVAYADAVEEALCFGWIDSLANTLDAERSIQLFTPRKPKSPWSKLNKTRVEKLIAQGLMTPAGLEKIEAAKKNGLWSAFDAVEDLIIPPDLTEALAANDTARTYFEAFSNSSKKAILWWIESAKRPETRAKRIEETVRLAAQNLKANQYRQ
jgi:uncharacterized protein YdeI (YjbR/CyaY-like superfamily)